MVANEQRVFERVLVTIEISPAWCVDTMTETSQVLIDFKKCIKLLYLSSNVKWNQVILRKELNDAILNPNVIELKSQW